MAALGEVGDHTSRVWRVTTAVRVFALALVAGVVVSDGSLGENVPMLVVLAMLAGVWSLLEWITRARNTHWQQVAETVLLSVLLAGYIHHGGLIAYIAVPSIVAGVRHGFISVLNVTMLAGVVAATTMAVGPGGDVTQRASSTALWLVIGLGVGLLASLQSRSIRGLTARQAPYVAAHHLMARLHQLAQGGAVGLDSTQLAGELELAMGEATGAVRSAVFAADASGHLRPVIPVADADRLEAEIHVSDYDRTPGAAVIPLRGANQVLGYCVLVGVQPWTDEMQERAMEVADDFALRLDTAVLFEEIRHLATSEERNRIARDMHDGVAQEIVALGYVVDEIESISPDEETRALASSLRSEISRVVTELRYSIFDLRHDVEEQRFSDALTDYAEQSHGDDASIEVHLTLDETGPPLSTRVQTELLRIAQEAIGNVRRHAHAQNLWVTFATDGFASRLVIEDDGIGDAAPKQRHWGLQTMRERAATIGAELTLEPRPGGGTTVRVQPCPDNAIERKEDHGHDRAPHR